MELISFSFKKLALWFGSFLCKRKKNPYNMLSLNNDGENAWCQSHTKSPHSRILQSIPYYVARCNCFLRLIFCRIDTRNHLLQILTYYYWDCYDPPSFFPSFRRVPIKLLVGRIFSYKQLKHYIILGSRWYMWIRALVLFSKS